MVNKHITQSCGKCRVIIVCKKYSIIIVSLIYTFFFLLLLRFVYAVVRITNKYVTRQITLQIKSRCSKPTNQIAFKDGQTDGKFLITVV